MVAMMATAARQAGLQTVRADVLTRAGFAHGFSTRGGGVSVVYGGADGDLNVGYTQLDMREAVEENRRRLLMDVYGEALPMVTLTQVHGSETRRVGAGDVAMAQKADGMMTDERQIVLGIQTADCVPVLVADRETGAVAAFHAGWRGTVQGIVQSGVGRMCAEYGCRPGRLVAAVGPCIGVCCYVVGPEVRAEFAAAFGYAGVLFAECVGETARSCLDLKEANRRQLLDAGLGAEAIEVMPACTACAREHFFSYRAEQGSTGRMLAVIAARRERVAG
jgi:YfiH family protein